MSYTTVATFTSPDGQRKAEIFRRQNGTFGFRAFVWDAEDSGWCQAGRYSEMITATEEDARLEMQGRLPWLATVRVVE